MYISSFPKRFGTIIWEEKKTKKCYNKILNTALQGIILRLNYATYDSHQAGSAMAASLYGASFSRSRYPSDAHLQFLSL